MPSIVFLLIIGAAAGFIVTLTEEPDPALLEMGHALIANRGGTTTRECCPARPSIAALLDAK